MTPGVANYPSCVVGDTIPVRQLTITETVGGITAPVDLSGATIKTDYINGSTTISKTIGTGITVTNAAGGVFQIDQFIIPDPGTYQFNIQITFPGTVVKTWLRGELLIVPVT